MSVRRHGRGPHPADTALFSAQHLSELQSATSHLSWLLSHGYAAPSSLKLVGDRFDLLSRQRTAVMRSACADHALESRSSRRIAAAELAGRAIEIDTLNLLITLEAALAGGIILGCRDQTYRDMASIHGSYRKAAQTQQAIEYVAISLRSLQAGPVLWRIDRPVSNSGRLRGMLETYAKTHQIDWEVRLDNDPDRVLGNRYEVVVTADAAVLDRVGSWMNLARWIVDQHSLTAWIVPMTPDTPR